MKNKNKLVALLLALLLIFVACGPKSGDTKDKDKENKLKDGALKGEITVQVEKGWKDYYQKAVERITSKNPEAKIKLKEISAFDHLDVIKNTDASNKDVADVFAIPADQFTKYAENQVLAPLPAQEMAKELGGYDDYDKGLGGNFKVEEEYLAFPYNIETLIAFVNTKNAKTLNVDYTKPLEISAQKDPATVLIPIFDAWFGVALNNPSNINLLSKDEDKFSSTYGEGYDKLTADQKSAFDSIYQYWKLNNDAKTPLFDKDAGWGYIDKEFTTGGKGVVRLEGPWAYSGGVIAKEAQAGNVEVYPIGQITLAGKPLKHWQSGWGLVVNSRIEKDQDKMNLSVALIKEIVNPKYAVDLFKATGKILPNVKPETYKESKLSDLEKKVIESVINSYKESTPRPLYKEYDKVWDTWKNSILSWNSVKPADANAAYKELNAAFTSMLQQIGQ